VNERAKPLLWSADGKRYSASGLVTHMWRLAQWEKAPVSVQGPARWDVPGRGTLVDLADAVLKEQDTDEALESENNVRKTHGAHEADLFEVEWRGEAE
jgi:hypothetical protein